MVNSLSLQLFHYLKGWIYWGFLLAICYLYCKLSMHVLLYILVSGCFYSFLSCYIIFFIICFISSSERKGQELHYSTWKTRRMRCIFNTLSILLAENREIYSFFSLFSPPLHKCVSHHFRGTISPKLLLAITSSTNLDSLFRSLYSWWGGVGWGWNSLHSSKQRITIF